MKNMKNMKNAIVTAALLLAIGAAPILEKGPDGLPVWLALLLVATFGNWNKKLDSESGGELCFGTAFWTALSALILTAIAGAIL